MCANLKEQRLCPVEVYYALFPYLKAFILHSLTDLTKDMIVHD